MPKSREKKNEMTYDTMANIPLNENRPQITPMIKPIICRNQ